MTREAELRQALNVAFEAAKGYRDRAAKEKRALNSEEEVAWTKAGADVVSLTKLLEEEMRSGDTEKLLQGQPAVKPPVPAGGDEPKADTQKRTAAFYDWVRRGYNGMAEENRSLLIPGKDQEVRALSIASGAAGQYTIPTDLESQVMVAMLSYSGVLQAGPNIITTDGGNPINYPTLNDTANVAEILGENTGVAEQDIAFGQKTIGAYKYSSKMIRVPIELLQDTAVDLENIIRTALAERFGRKYNTDLTTGNGTTAPEGLNTFATLGKTTAGAAAVTSDEILDLIHSVDPAYRDGARLMMNDATLLAVMKLKDSQNQYLFQVSAREGAPSTIHGRRFTINQAMPSMATTNRFMLFCNLNPYYVVRRAMGISMLRLTERYAELGQVAFLAFARMDAKGIDAGGGAIKYMRNA